jgi:hypothetical protein
VSAAQRGPDGIRVFATAAARDSKWPNGASPGQVVMLVDTAEFLVYYGSLAGWRPPWNVPWGEVARTVDSGAAAVFFDQSEHETPGLATTFTAVHNRKYRITLNAAVGTNDISSIGQGYLRFVDQFAGRHTIPTVEFAHRIWMPAGLSPIEVAFESEATFETGSHIIRVMTKSDQTAGLNITTGDGGATIAAEPAILTIDDIGACAPPVYG